MDEAGAVEKHIDRADGLGDSAHRLRVGHVQGVSGSVDFAAQRGQRPGIDIRRDHAGALRGESNRGGPADALPGGGDEGCFAS